MAIFNEIMTPRISRAIQKYFQFKGPQSVKSVAGDVTVSLPLFWGREARFLEAWSQQAGRIGLVAGGAGNISTGQIRNPAGSNIIAVIEKISISLGAADQALLAFTTQNSSDLAILGQMASLDSRWGATNALPNQAICVVSGKNNTAASIGSIFGSAQLAANVTYEYITTDIQEIVLLPDSTLYINAATANEQLVANFMWRERFLEESERAK